MKGNFCYYNTVVLSDRCFIAGSKFCEIIGDSHSRLGFVTLSPEAVTVVKHFSVKTPGMVTLSFLIFLFNALEAMFKYKALERKVN